jgi:hypothetical protein
VAASGEQEGDGWCRPLQGRPAGFDIAGQSMLTGAQESGGVARSAATHRTDTMSSRAKTEAARLRRLRRIGHRLGLTILTTSKPDPKIVNGGYMLSADEGFEVLLGNRPKPYSASLDDIEAYLDKREADAGEAE